MPALADNHMTLGSLIDALKRCKPESEVSFNFASARPSNHIASYRGFYEDLAIAWSDGSQACLEVRDLLKILESCVGRTFEGYKGGSYTASRDTALWVANWGCAGSTAIVGVKEKYGTTILLTEIVGV